MKNHFLALGGNAANSLGILAIIGLIFAKTWHFWAFPKIFGNVSVPHRFQHLKYSRITKFQPLSRKSRHFYFHLTTVPH